MLVGAATAPPPNLDVNYMTDFNFYTVILPALILGFINYYLVIFIDFCFNENNILDWYYRFILTRVEPRSRKLAKVLGMCAVCMGFWVGVGVYSLHCWYLGLHPVGFIAFVALNQYLLIKRFVDPEAEN